MDGLIISENHEKGFHLLHDTNTWRIAICNSTEKGEPIPNHISRHFETDESFILLKGSGLLVTAAFQQDVPVFSPTPLAEGKVYTVLKGVWHAHMWSPNSQVLIVENSQTNKENSESHSLSDSERQSLAAKISQ